MVAESVPRLSSRIAIDALERGPQVQRPAEGLADLEEVGQLARVRGAGRHAPIMTEMSVASDPDDKLVGRI